MSTASRQQRSVNGTGWLACVGLALLLVLAQALPLLAEDSAARIEVPDDYYYFGYMPRDVVVSHTYWIKNSGGDTLRIVKVKPTCGCTAVPLVTDAIAPGDSAELKITFDSKLMTGKVVKEVDIFTNDPVDPIKSVKFFAVVNQTYPNLVVEPGTLRFSKFGSKDGRIVKEMKIKNAFADDVEISFTEFPNKYFKIDKKSAKIGAGDEVVFTLEQVEVPTVEADYLTSLTLECDGPETERITIPIVCYFTRGE